MNKEYQRLLHTIKTEGDQITTRNHGTYSAIGLSTVIDRTPLVTIRATAWKKALREMEWFMSGDRKCPDELIDWWAGQLSPSGKYYFGYGDQLRRFGDCFDQIAFSIEGIKSNPNSRRLVITTWNPGEASVITELNNNPNTPTCCHGTVVQLFVRNGKLNMTHYQRSADMLLGAPHNFIQYWGLLLYFSYHTSLNPGKIYWTFGDAHIYNEESHIQATEEILNAYQNDFDGELVYQPESVEYDEAGVPLFKVSDFKMNGDIPKPMVKIRPKLL